MIVAIIPARSGSKRIPKKNIREFLGTPIMAYSVQAAIRSELFDRIVVSTDSDEIAATAERLGAEVPFRRPEQLADDQTPTVKVVQHALAELTREDDDIDYACCLYPASPFILASDLRQAYGLLEAEDADYCVPVTEYPYPIQRAVAIRSDSRLELLQPELIERRSQDLETYYHDTGQFYFGRAHAFAAGLPLLGSRSLALVIPHWRVRDIDWEDDWKTAELLYEALVRRELL
jgi:N-acylneuraminate cytidylyltransferase